MDLKRALHSKMGAIVISVMLGLGLAALFRRVCKGDGCILVQSPDSEEVKKHVYRVGYGESEACYRYTPRAVACPKRA